MSVLHDGVDLGQGLGTDRPRDLPCGGEFALVEWRKRRWRCRTQDCPQGSFTVTDLRQRVTRELLGRRGRKIDPVWANRRLLLHGRERLSEAATARMWNGCVDHDPSGQILSAWIAKEELRALCATAARGGHPGEIRARLYSFYRWCADETRRSPS